MKFSANLGFLYQNCLLPDAIRAARRDGFDAVECHWPYDTPAEEVVAALGETGLSMLGLNTRRGDVSAGENGMAALPDRGKEARAAIDEAIAYADAIDCGAIHVMAGKTEAPSAHAQFVDNLRHATSSTHRTILIEPLNPHDVPGYFLKTMAQARSIIEEVGAPNLKIMFDCYHVARTEGDVMTKFCANLPLIGHVQFAGVPARGVPDQGEINFHWLLSKLHETGWKQPFGAEYKPNGDTVESLGWMKLFKS